MARRALGAALLACGWAAWAQGPDGLTSEDLAILDSAEPRAEFDCQVKGLEPRLASDFRLHAGFEARVRLGSPTPQDTLFDLVVRVSPEANRSAPIYFRQPLRAPMAADAPGKALGVAGSFAVGEGSYRVDWLLRDPAGQACSSHWIAEARLPSVAGGISLVAPGNVEPSDLDPFRREPPPPSSSEVPLRVKVLVNFAARSVSPAILEPQNIDPLLAVLRGMVRDGRISRFSLVAFLLADQRVVYRQVESPGIDFPQLGKTLHGLELGTVEYDRLRQERGPERFLADLLKREFETEDKPDALIILSPRLRMTEDIPTRDLKRLGPPGFPVFYLKTGRIPLPDPPDAIGRLLGVFKGREYRILNPAEIGHAVSEVARRIHRRKVN